MGERYRGVQCLVSPECVSERAFEHRCDRRNPRRHLADRFQRGLGTWDGRFEHHCRAPGRAQFLRCRRWHYGVWNVDPHDQRIETEKNGDAVHPFPDPKQLCRDRSQSTPRTCEYLEVGRFRGYDRRPSRIDRVAVTPLPRSRSCSAIALAPCQSLVVAYQLICHQHRVCPLVNLFFCRLRSLH